MPTMEEKKTTDLSGMFKQTKQNFLTEEKDQTARSFLFINTRTKQKIELILFIFIVVVIVGILIYYFTSGR